MGRGIWGNFLDEWVVILKNFCRNNWAINQIKSTKASTSYLLEIGSHRTIVYIQAWDQVFAPSPANLFSISAWIFRELLEKRMKENDIYKGYVYVIYSQNFHISPSWLGLCSKSGDGRRHGDTRQRRFYHKIWGRKVCWGSDWPGHNLLTASWRPGLMERWQLVPMDEYYFG